MITCTLENINPAKEKAFREWLARDQFDTLIEIIESSVKLLQVAALKDATEGRDNEGQLERANMNLRDAYKFRCALEILGGIVSQAESYKTAKLS